MLVTKFSATWFCRELRRTSPAVPVADPALGREEVLVDPFCGAVSRGFGWASFAGMYRRYVHGRYRETLRLPYPLRRIHGRTA